ncbi:MAG TPA: serine/threonine-protein kinase [Polyangiaceae bacterium]|jgi:serine/threonine-protein kinase|nr:serine/threonine-protein kinase [Polyangiaceae bacterium]
MHARNADDELRAEAEQRVGLVLRDKWRLDHVLGVGGMGAVYSATHRNGSRGAVKVLHAALTLSREIRLRFAREGYAANQVNHPGVVQVIDDDEDQGVVFMVMELLDGETLEERWLRNGSRLPATEVLSMADQVLDVLAAAHDKGIVHRDLKPENLFLTKEGRVKVLDFGIARLRHTSTSPRAGTGGTFGTPAFMPPEQALGHADLVDAKSDLWALGATLFTLLSGRPVHEGTTINEQLLSAMTRPAPLLELVTQCIAPEVAALVDRALATDKSERFDDALSMQEAVRAAYGALPEFFDDLPTVIISDGAPRASVPTLRRDSDRPPVEAVAPAIRSAPPPLAIPWLVKHRAVVASASAGFVVMAGFFALNDRARPVPLATVATVVAAPPTAPEPAPVRVVTTVPAARAAREVTPKAVSFDDLPRATDDDTPARVNALAAVPPALASAIAQGGRETPPARAVEPTPLLLDPTPPVEPRDVHLDDAIPSPYDDANPYDDAPSAPHRPAQKARAPVSR